MGKLGKEIDRAQSAGEMVIGDSFERCAQVRSIESTLEAGDVFEIPARIEVRGIDMGRLDRRGKKVVAEYMFVENQNGDAKKLFPSMLQKRVRRYEKQENPGDPLIPVEGANAYAVSTGSACDKLIKDYGDVNKFFADFKEGRPLAGKKIQVTKIDHIYTKMYDRDEPTTSPVYQFDLV